MYIGGFSQGTQTLTHKHTHTRLSLSLSRCLSLYKHSLCLSLSSRASNKFGSNNNNINDTTSSSDARYELILPGLPNKNEEKKTVKAAARDWCSDREIDRQTDRQTGVHEARHLSFVILLAFILSLSQESIDPSTAGDVAAQLSSVLFLIVVVTSTIPETQSIRLETAHLRLKHAAVIGAMIRSPTRHLFAALSPTTT